MRRIKLATPLLCVAFAFLALSCSPKTGSTETSPASSPSTANDPAKPAMPGAQSANWKVSIVWTEKIPKPTGIPEDRALRTTTLHDTLVVALQVEYLGAPGDVTAPSAALVDDKERRFEIMAAGIANSPEYRFTSFEDPAAKALFEIVNWVNSAASEKLKKGEKAKSRKLSTGDKFSINYEFEDPKSSGINLIFADVAPISLPPAKDPEPSK